MPQRRNNAVAPPEVMTMSKAMPVLVVAGIFDAVRAFFEMFWFFGPALAAALCTIVGSNTTIGSLVGTTITAGACSLVAGAAGVLGVELTAPFGVIMADAMGLMGFLVLFIWILTTNARIFKAVMGGSMWFVGGFAIAEVPLIGTLPMFSIVLWRLYKKQIAVEHRALKKYQGEQAAVQLQEQRQEIAHLMQLQAVQQAQMEQDQQAANEAEYEDEASNDAEYGGEEIPEEVRKVA